MIEEAILELFINDPEIKEKLRAKVIESIDTISINSLQDAVLERLSFVIENIELDELYREIEKVITSDAKKKLKEVFSNKK